MNLYEVTNGYVGNSYVRAYAWAENEEQALELAREKFRAERDSHEYNGKHTYKTNYWKNLTCRFLFSDDAEPFATTPDDNDGW